MMGGRVDGAPFAPTVGTSNFALVDLVKGIDELFRGRLAHQAEDVDRNQRENKSRDNLVEPEGVGNARGWASLPLSGAVNDGRAR